MVFSYVLVGNNKSATTKKCRRIAGDFDCHADSKVQGGAHHPIEHIQGFTWNPWMLPSGKYLHRIAPAAAMVDKLVETTLNTTKTQHLPSNYGTFRSLVIVRILTTKRTLYSTHQCDKLHLNVKCHDWS